MRVFHNVVIREKPPSKRPRIRSSEILKKAFESVEKLTRQTVMLRFVTSHSSTSL